jgi:hypothetical protein
MIAISGTRFLPPARLEQQHRGLDEGTKCVSGNRTAAYRRPTGSTSSFIADTELCACAAARGGTGAAAAPVAEGHSDFCGAVVVVDARSTNLRTAAGSRPTPRRKASKLS